MAEYNLGTARGKVEIDAKDIQNASRELREADIVLRQSGQSLIQFGQQALAAFGYVVDIGAKFEKEMDFVQAVNGETEASMEKLKQKAIELGKEGPFGPVALSQAFVELAKAGVGVEELVNGVAESVVNLAGAADIDPTAAGEIVVQTMAIFGLAAEEVPRATDIIAGAANASMIDVQDFATTLKYAGPVAASLGVDLEDLATTVALLGQAGIRGSTAGTSLRQTMLNLSGATPKARDRMKELGLITEDGSNQFYDAAGNVKDLTSVFEILGQSLEGLTEKQKSEALRDIFGVRQLPTILTLMEAGRAEFDKFNDAINETTAADVAADRLDNLDGAVKKFKATLESVLLGPSGEFQGMLQRFVEAATELLRWFDELPGPVKTFLVGAVGVVGVLSLMSGAFLLTVGTMVRAVRVLAEISTVAARLGPALKTVAGGMRLLNLAFLTSPIFWLIAAIVALGVAFYLLYTRVEGFRNFIDSAWQKIQEIWDSILEFAKSLPENFGKAIDAVEKKISELGEAFGNFFLDVRNRAAGIWDSITEGVSTAFNSVIDFFTGLPGLIGDALSELPGVVAGAFSAAMDAARAFLFRILPRAVGFAIGFVIGMFVRLSVQLPQLIVQTLLTILTTLQGWAVTIITTMRNVVVGLVAAWIDFLVGLPGRIWGALMEILGFLIAWGPQIVSTAWSIGSDLVSTIWGFITSIPGIFWDAFTEVLGFLAGLIPQMLQLGLDIGQAVWDGITDIITGLPGLVTDILDDVINAFTNLITNAFNAAKNFAGGLWDGFKEGLGINSPSYIEEALFAIDDQAIASAKNLARQVRSMQSLSTGIPGINSGAVGLPPAATQSGNQYNQNAPLIGSATIKDERDAYVLANELEKERARRVRGQGGLIYATV